MIIFSKALDSYVVKLREVVLQSPLQDSPRISQGQVQIILCVIEYLERRAEKSYAHTVISGQTTALTKKTISESGRKGDREKLRNFDETSSESLRSTHVTKESIRQFVHTPLLKLSYVRRNVPNRPAIPCTCFNATVEVSCTACKWSSFCTYARGRKTSRYQCRACTRNSSLTTNPLIRQQGTTPNA